MAHIKMTIGYGPQTVGTIELTPNGRFKFTGDVAEVSGVIKSIRDLDMYHNLADEELMRRLPQILSGFTWASPDVLPAES